MSHFTSDQLAEATHQIQDILKDLPLAISRCSPFQCLFEHAQKNPDISLALITAVTNDISKKVYEKVSPVTDSLNWGICGELKRKLLKKLQQGENILQFVEQILLKEFSRIIQDKSLEPLYEKIVWHSLGDILQLSLE